MPRFHLHIVNGDGYTPDEEGQELPSLAVARHEAIKGARSLMSAEVLEGALDLRSRIEISEAGGRILEVVRFSDAIVIQAETGIVSVVAPPGLA